MQAFCQVLADKKVSHSQQKICKLLATVSEKLSDLIQRRLQELNLSKAELSRRTGFSRTYITDLANGTGNTQSGQYTLPPDSSAKLAKALEISENEILKAIGYNVSDDELVANGLFDGYYELSDERKALARKQIAALIRSLQDEDFEE